MKRNKLRGAFIPLERRHRRCLSVASGNLSLTGFTFVEIIIVMAMVSVVSLAIYSVFNNGLKIWQKVNQQLPSEDLNIFFDRFRSDVKNCFSFTGIAFLGTSDLVELPTIVKVRNLNAETVGKVAYIYDSGKRALLRQERDFSQVFNAQEGLTTFKLSGVEDARFEYYFFDKAKSIFTWKDDWVGQSSLPLAVRLILEVEEGNGSDRFIKTVNIPLSEESD